MISKYDCYIDTKKVATLRVATLVIMFLGGYL